MLFYENPDRHHDYQESTLTLTFTHFYVYDTTNSQTEAAYDSMGSTFRACSYYPAFLLAEISRLAGRIFPCIHIRHFIPLAEMNSEFFLLAPAKRVHFNNAAQQLGDVGVFLYLFARKRIALISNIFDTFT